MDLQGALEKMPSEMLRWPYRIILYVFCYIVWAMVSLLIFAFVPSVGGLAAVNVIPAGWLTTAAIFFLDLYLTQVRKTTKQI